jgi:predicted nucleic acid-binding protein
VDANLLIYSQVSELKEHPAARAWFDDRLSDSSSRIGLPWPSLLAFAHLAALAIEHGLTLCRADRGFARFSGLRWENPLGS